MALTRAAAALGVVAIAVAAVGALRSLYGLFTGQYVAAAAVVVALVAVSVALTTAVGARAPPRTETPYW